MLFVTGRRSHIFSTFIRNDNKKSYNLNLNALGRAPQRHPFPIASLLTGNDDIGYVIIVRTIVQVPHFTTARDHHN